MPFRCCNPACMTQIKSSEINGYSDVSGCLTHHITVVSYPKRDKIQAVQKLSLYFVVVQITVS